MRLACSIASATAGGVAPRKPFDCAAILYDDGISIYISIFSQVFYSSSQFKIHAIATNIVCQSHIFKLSNLSQLTPQSSFISSNVSHCSLTHQTHQYTYTLHLQWPQPERKPSSSSAQRAPRAAPSSNPSSAIPKPQLNSRSVPSRATPPNPAPRPSRTRVAKSFPYVASC